jgi:predicted dehydrogenase
MHASPDMAAVAVVLRVPSHYEPTRAVLQAGTHVCTAWPLGKNTAEAEALAALARQQGVQTFVGRQDRATPAILSLQELLNTGYAGEVRSWQRSLLRDGVLQRLSDRTWQCDGTLGATTLTSATGHAIEAWRFVMGAGRHLAAVVTTQVPQWLE